ncbi:MAG: Dyp-type peroxidase [Alphaproteobacteria bacterium]|nr:Dyp-type peroxidase [Alphaproteobacteria bacterium]
MPPQPGVLAPVPPSSVHLTFALRPEVDAATLRHRLSLIRVDEGLLVGLGAPATVLLGMPVPGVRPFPALAGPGIAVPSTQGAAWIRLSGHDPGTLVVEAQDVLDTLGDVLVATDVLHGFLHDGGRDLTGYVDGTENPKGDDAVTAAIDDRGFSFLAVQQWVHDLRTFAAHGQAERDRMIGRTLDDDVELVDAPEWAHVKRTAQESFEPEAFVVRRSTPYADGPRHGLLFLAFGRSFDAYEAQLRRMVGLEDGITDALFRFSRPVTGGYYVVPPVDGHHLALSGV